MQTTNEEVIKKGQKGSRRQHDVSLRRKLAKIYSNGEVGLSELSRFYNVHHTNIIRWAKQYCSELREEKQQIPMTEQEQKELKELQKQVDALKKKLEYEQMRNFALETMADLAKTELGIDIRKNFGAKQPKK